MSKGIKYALMFTGGAIMGIGACAKAVCHFIDKETLSDKVIPSIKRKVTDNVYYLFYAYTPEERYRRGFGPFKTFVTDDIVIYSKEKAESIIEELKSFAANEGFVTEEELYKIVDVDNPRASKYSGWTLEMLENAQVYCEKGIYKLLLPTMCVNRFKYTTDWS